MRGVGPTPHRVWRYSVLAWVFLVAWASARAVLPWHLGIGGMIGMIGDLTGIHNIFLLYARSNAASAAVLVFGVFAPLAAAFDYIARGRTSRAINVLLGAALAVPALNLMLWWNGTSIANLMHHGIGIGSLLWLPLAGMIVGLGVRHRKPVGPLTRISHHV